MKEKNQSSFAKHLEFVALLKSDIHMPDKNTRTGTVLDDNDTENTVDLEQLQALNAAFDELFGPVD